MKIKKKLVIMVLIAQIFFVPAASAYEGIFHYAWTYYLALQVGYTERQAYQIASGANAIDWDDQTNPVASPIDSQIDTVFGAERFRYFDKDLNALWVKLDDILQADSTLNTIDQDTTLLKLRRVLEVKKDKSPTFDETWKQYYDTLITSNPAVRTWVQLHAFQPVVLQKHKEGNPETNINFASENPDRIALDSPLTGVSHNDRGWIFTNSMLTWGLGRMLKQPNSDRNGEYSKRDAYTFDLFNDTVNFCGKESIRTCLIEECKNVNEATNELESIQKTFQVHLKEAPPDVQPPLECNDGVLIKKTQNAIHRNNQLLSDIRDAAIKNNNFGLQDHLKIEFATEFNTLMVDNTAALPYLSHIQKYQEETKMSWPLIYSSLLRDIQTYVLNEYWEPTAPTMLGISHAPTKAVNAVRGKVVSQLKELSEQDGNPGPLLHYIQDIHSHGPYNTYNGHALANHVPDFITQEFTFNAVNATIDTIIVLCEFMDHLKKSARNRSSAPPKVFVGQKTVKSELCSLVEKELSEAGKLTYASSNLRKYISKSALFPGKTLEGILTELGRQSFAPALQNSNLTMQGLQKLMASPPHATNPEKTTAWTNEMIGLPDFPRAVQYLSEQVNSTLIPVWRKNNLRVEDRAMSHPSLDKPYHNTMLYEWKWAPSNIPTGLIQYDYDYCGRVIKGDMNWPASDKPDEYLGDAKSCDQMIAGSGVLHKGKVKEDTNALYKVEDIAVDIVNFSIEFVTNGAALSTVLEYKISGIAPGLDGGRNILLTKPKDIKLDVGVFPITVKTVQPEASTDMYPVISQIDHGPDHLPILESCQLLVAHADKVKEDMSWILNVNPSDKEKAADDLYDYMFRTQGPNPEGLSNFTMLLKANRYKTGGPGADRESHSVLKYDETTASDIPLQQYMKDGAEVYLACSVHVQGMTPVVALRKVDRGLTSKVEKVLMKNPFK